MTAHYLLSAAAPLTSRAAPLAESEADRNARLRKWAADERRRVAKIERDCLAADHFKWVRRHVADQPAEPEPEHTEESDA